MLSLGARRNGYMGAAAPLLALVLASSPAAAHFKITSPPSWMSQDAVGGPQKNGPCAKVPNIPLGDTAGTPTNTVTVMNAGATTTVSLDVTIAHPGWFRIALVEGASSTQTLATLPDPQAQKGTNCTPAIMSNPVWSSTQPILADGLPAGSTATTEQQNGTHTFQVTIPSTAVCTSTSPCTLQVIMVMTDHPADDCYYHHCADISLGAAVDGGGRSTGEDATVAVDASGETRDASGASSSGSGSSGAVSTDASESTASGGATGSAGSSASGATGSSGSSESIGIPGTGGSAGSSAGESNATVPSSAASSGAGGSGNNTNAAGPADSSSGGGCGLSAGGGAPWALGAAGFFAVSTVRRRRRRH
jgi:hypothetical protein